MERYISDQLTQRLEIEMQKHADEFFREMCQGDGSSPPPIGLLTVDITPKRNDTLINAVARRIGVSAVNLQTP